MKMLQKGRISKFIAISLLSAFGFFSFVASAQDTGLVVDKIIGKVDNYIVLKSELEMAYQSYLAEGNPSSEEARCELFNRLIMNKLMVAKAETNAWRNSTP